MNIFPCTWLLILFQQLSGFKTDLKPVENSVILIQFCSTLYLYWLDKCGVQQKGAVLHVDIKRREWTKISLIHITWAAQIGLELLKGQVFSKM